MSRMLTPSVEEFFVIRGCLVSTFGWWIHSALFFFGEMFHSKTLLSDYFWMSRIIFPYFLLFYFYVSISSLIPKGDTEREKQYVILGHCLVSPFSIEDDEYLFSSRWKVSSFDTLGATNSVCLSSPREIVRHLREQLSVQWEMSRMLYRWLIIWGNFCPIGIS